MDQPPDTEGRSGLNQTQIVIALIGATATVLAALLTGFFGLLDRQEPVPTAAPLVTPQTMPSVTIEGPTTAVLGELTYFTIVSANADRAVWSIGGFNNNETQTIAPLAPSHQLEIEPTDRSRIGDTFTLVVTAYDQAGESATATHKFQVVDVVEGE